MAGARPMQLTRSERFWQKWLLRIRPAFLASALKRLLRLRRRDVQTDHGRFFIDPVSQFGNALTSASGYEPEMRLTLQRYLKPGAVFLDIGANEGYFSVLAAQLVGRSGRVIAVEPQHRLDAVLERNLAQNEVDWVTRLSCAISDHHGKEQLHLSPDTNTGSTGLRAATRYKVPCATVDVITLTELFDSAGLAQVDLLKMDIEGFEYEAILGSPELLRSQRIRALALELHPWHIEARGLDPAAIESFLRSAGYEPDAGAATTVWVPTTGLSAVAG